MDNDLLCNIRDCRKKLSTIAWVTACSHVFCDDCASAEFSHVNKCPICHENLGTSRNDLNRVDLQPNDEFKCTVLSGLKPSIIMEICSRALSFWSFQTCQELAYLESTVSKAKERRVAVEQFVVQQSSQAQASIKSLKGKLTCERKEMDELRSKVNELQGKLEEKSRQHCKLQNSYDSLRRQLITKMSSAEGSRGGGDGRTNTATPGLMLLGSNQFARPLLPPPSSSSSSSTSVTRSASMAARVLQSRPSPRRSPAVSPPVSRHERTATGGGGGGPSRRRRHDETGHADIDESSYTSRRQRGGFTGTGRPSGRAEGQRISERGRSYSPTGFEGSRRSEKLF